MTFESICRLFKICHRWASLHPHPVLASADFKPDALCSQTRADTLALTYKEIRIPFIVILFELSSSRLSLQCEFTDFGLSLQYSLCQLSDWFHVWDSTNNSGVIPWISFGICQPCGLYSAYASSMCDPDLCTWFTMYHTFYLVQDVAPVNQVCAFAHFL